MRNGWENLVRRSASPLRPGCNTILASKRAFRPRALGSDLSWASHTAKADSACASFTPRKRRAIIRSQPVFGLSRREFPRSNVGCIISGAQMSGAAPTSSPKNCAGVTPIMVNSWLSTVMRWPITEESRANPRFQKP